MLVSDWRDLDATTMCALYERERDAWRRELFWDASGIWAAVEHARTTWGLPGLVARTAGRIVGWAFYLHEDGFLKIGGFVAETREATAALLEALIDRARPRQDCGISLFVYDRAVALAHLLDAHGFTVERYQYLSVPLPLPAGAYQRSASTRRTLRAASEAPPRTAAHLGGGFASLAGISCPHSVRAGRLERPPEQLTRVPEVWFFKTSRADDVADVELCPVRACRGGVGGVPNRATVQGQTRVTGPWRAGDVASTAELLAAAYGTNGTYFAPHNRREEWQRYVRNLVEHAGVGVLMPEASRVVREGARLRSVVLLTQIADRTAHVAQVAVDPALRRQGLAATLVTEACALASDAGCTVATLLVGTANRAARTLYERLGFRANAAFIAATRQPRVHVVPEAWAAAVDAHSPY